MAESTGDYVDKYCMNCFYYKTMHSPGYRCCHYIFIEGHSRPCDPGKGCTVKIRRKRYNELNFKKGGNL